jgi:hypothetical protein
VNNSKSSSENQQFPEPRPDWIESFNAPNVETLIVEGGEGDNTIRPMPEWMRPYINGWVPRPEKPPKHDG